MRRFVLWIPPLALMGAIFWASHQSDLAPPLAPDVPNLDKLYHAGVFAILALLWVLAFRASGGRWLQHAALLAFLVTAAYGVVDEVHQAFIPGREADGWDVLADAAGALVAALLARWRMGPPAPPG